MGDVALYHVGRRSFLPDDMYFIPNMKPVVNNYYNKVSPFGIIEL